MSCRIAEEPPPRWMIETRSLRRGLLLFAPLIPRKKPASRAFSFFHSISSEYQVCVGLLPDLRGYFGVEVLLYLCLLLSFDGEGLDTISTMRRQIHSFGKFCREAGAPSRDQAAIEAASVMAGMKGFQKAPAIGKTIPQRLKPKTMADFAAQPRLCPFKTGRVPNSRKLLIQQGCASGRHGFEPGRFSTVASAMTSTATCLPTRRMKVLGSFMPQAT